MRSPPTSRATPRAENDPLWRMPLWRPYESLLDSKIADINNVGGSFAGSITAALFLSRFVDRGEGLGAFRHLCLDAERQAGAAGRRRMPGRARALCAAEASATAWSDSGSLPLHCAEIIRLRNDLEPRMAVELRPSQALKLLQDFTLTLVTDGEPDLSARQLAILLTIYLEPPPHTVRGLAAKLKVTKPVITRALDTMGKLGAGLAPARRGRPPQRRDPAHAEGRARGRAARRRADRARRRELPR